MRTPSLCFIVVAVFMTGCCTVPGGPDCDRGSQLWNCYCDGAGTCGGVGCVAQPADCEVSGLWGHLKGALFGNSCAEACDSGCASCDSGCASCDSGSASACGPVACGSDPAACGGVVQGMPMGVQGPMMGSISGCAGNACDGRCGGRCPIAASRAGQMAHRTAGAARAAVGHVVRTPQRIHDRCANGFCGHAAGPTQGAVTYPYYTTRGPRDFLLAHPPSIGP